MNFREFRANYPMYDDLDDYTLASKLHKKFYSDMDFSEFAKRIEYGPMEPGQPAVHEQVKIEQRAEQPIGQFEYLAKSAIEQIPKIEGAPQIPSPTMPEIAQISGAGVVPQTPLAAAHQPPVELPTELQAAHAPETPLPPMTDIGQIPKDFLKLVGMIPSGLGYAAGFVKGPEAGGHEFPTLEQRHERGVEYAQKAAAPITGIEQAMGTAMAPAGEPTGTDIALEHLFKLGDVAGAKTLKETGNPYLAAAAATTIQAAPILLPLIGRRMPGVFRRLQASTPYRMMTIKERGLVLQTLEETLAKNPKMTEAEVLRKYPGYFEEAKAKRAATEQPMGEEPIITPEAPKAAPEQVAPVPKEVTPEISQEKPIAPPAQVETPAPTQVLQPPEGPVPPAAAPEQPGQVTPFPGREEGPPAPSQKPQPVPLPEPQKPEISQMAKPISEPEPEIEQKTAKPEITEPEVEPITAETKPPEQLESEIIERIKQKEVSGIDYTEEIEIEETGQVIRAKKDAGQRLREIDNDIKAYRDLMDCIGKLGK